MSQRIEQLNSLIQREVAEIILRELDLPKEFLVTVTRVGVATDAESAKVWISVLPADSGDDALKKIQQNIVRIQQILNERLVMKFVPKLTFVLDSQQEKASRITEVLDTLLSEDVDLPPPPPAA